MKLEMLNLINRLLCFLVIAFALSPAHAVDIPPGKMVAPPPGKSALRIDMDSYKTGEKYNKGKSLNLDTEVEVQSIGLQYSRSFTVNDKPTAFYINSRLARALPGGSLSGLDNEYGLTDTVAALVHWFHTDRQKERYFALGSFFFLPTGDYDSDRLINLSGNRFSAALLLAHHSKLTEKWDLMLSTDVLLFGKNDDYRLTHQNYEQRPLYSLQTSVMHHVDPTLMISASYFLHKGGEGKLDGVDQYDEIDRDRYELAVIKKIGPGKLYVFYGQDVRTENGFIVDDKISLRYQFPLK